jgi:hypothetical protein
MTINGRGSNAEPGKKGFQNTERKTAKDANLSDMAANDYSKSPLVETAVEDLRPDDKIGDEVDLDDNGEGDAVIRTVTKIEFGEKSMDVTSDHEPEPEHYYPGDTVKKFNR